MYTLILVKTLTKTPVLRAAVQRDMKGTELKARMREAPVVTSVSVCVRMPLHELSTIFHRMRLCGSVRGKHSVSTVHKLSQVVVTDVEPTARGEVGA